MKDEIPTIVYKKKKNKQKFYSINMKGICATHWHLVFFLAEFAWGRPRCPQGGGAGRKIWSLMKNVGMYLHIDLPGHCNDTLAN